MRSWVALAVLLAACKGPTPPPADDAGTEGPGSENEVGLSEDAPPGTLVREGVAELISGNLNSAFAVDGEKRLVVSGSLDFETVPRFLLRLRLTDDSELPLAVVVKDANERPVLSGGPFVGGSLRVGATVGTMSVVDPDRDQRHTFSIVGGDPEGFLEFTAEGVLRVARAGAGLLLLTVRATDDGAPPLSGELEVRVQGEGVPFAVADGPLKVLPGGSALNANLFGNDSLPEGATVSSFGGALLGGMFPANGAAVPFDGGTVAMTASGALTVTASAGAPLRHALSYTVQASAGTSTAAITLQLCAHPAAGSSVKLSPGAPLCVGHALVGSADFYLVGSNGADAGVILSVEAQGISGSVVDPVGPPPAGPDRHQTHFHLQDHLEHSVRLGSGVDAGAPLLTTVAVPRDGGSPAMGALWTLNRELTDDCGAAVSQNGYVVYTGTRAIVVEDTDRPANGLTAGIPGEGYQLIGQTFDDLLYPAVTSELGEPSDLDRNGKVVLFFTAQLNRDTPAGMPAVLAYHHPRDLFSQAQCAGSNGGELIYLPLADPNGTINGNLLAPSTLEMGGPPAIAHELAHLILDSRRMYSASQLSFEEPWLEEGLAGLADERVFFETTGLSTETNLDLPALNSQPSSRLVAFNTYVSPLLGRYRPWLMAPNREGLSSRGAAWAFARYLVDRAPTSELSFVPALVVAPSRGRAKLSAAIGTDVGPWLHDFAVAALADDLDVGLSVPAQHRLLSYHLRSIYGGLGGYPLHLGALADKAPLEVPLAGNGGAVYLKLAIPAGSLVDLITAGGGEVTVFRRN
jgi:hypothetical protein